MKLHIEPADSITKKALILGIASIPLVFFIPLPIAGIIVSIVALKRYPYNAKAIWGLILSLIALPVALIIFLAFTSAASDVFTGVQLDEFPSTNGPKETQQWIDQDGV